MVPTLAKNEGWGSLKLWSSMEPKREDEPAPDRPGVFDNDGVLSKHKEDR